MRCIGDNTNNKTIEVEIEIRIEGTQQPENLLNLSTEVELDK